MTQVKIKMAELAGLIGADHILFGSDYPHREGLAEPTTYVDQLTKLSAEDQALIIGGNPARRLSAQAGRECG